MLKSTALCVCLCALLIVSTSAQKQPDQLIEIFRHGARGPLSPYDPSWPTSQWGVLTAVGMRQQYILGKVLSEKYSDLLGAAYNYSQVYMISDTTPRCIQSALTHLYGIYLGTGPGLRDGYPPELAIPPYQDPLVKKIADSLEDFQALPYREVPNIVNIVDNTNAYIFQGDSSNYCPNMDKWETENSVDAAEQEAFNQIFNDTITNVNKLLSEELKLTSAMNVSTFGDVVLANLYDNRTLPGNLTDPQLVANVTHAFTWFIYHNWLAQPIQRQLASFNLVDAVLTELANYRAGNTYNKAAFYSGHDSNVLAVLAAFNVVNEDCIVANFESYLENNTLVYPNCYFPYFASDIAFEFYNDTNSPTVEFYYNGVLIPLCNGQDSCSYDDFVAFAKNATGNNTLKTYYQKCGANQTVIDQADTQSTNDSIIMINEPYAAPRIEIRAESVAIVGLSVLCSLLIIQLIRDRRRFNKIAEEKRNESALSSDFLII